MDVSLKYEFSKVLYKCIPLQTQSNHNFMIRKYNNLNKKLNAHLIKYNTEVIN